MAKPLRVIVHDQCLLVSLRHPVVILMAVTFFGSRSWGLRHSATSTTMKNLVRRGDERDDVMVRLC